MKKTLLFLVAGFFFLNNLPAQKRDDLMRQKRFGTVMRAYATKYNTSKGANFRDDRDYLFPIPQGERDKSNNILSQNPVF